MVTATSDNTAAYREFISDLVPFRRHLRVSIEHGDRNGVEISATMLAHYYAKPAVHLVLTDTLLIGDSGSEPQHSYSITNQTWQGSRTFTFEGELFGTDVTASGRVHRGTSTFAMAIDPGNDGVVLRRLFDQGVADQRAQVSVDGSVVGTWYKAGANGFARWREEEFAIPAAFTTGKSRISITVSYVSSAVDWNEFRYTAYSLMP